MKAAFIETTDFTAWVSIYLPDKDYSRLQQSLLNNPALGAVMVGCGGLRKVRIADPKRGQGKRGGARVIYLYIPEVRRFYLLDVYGKNEKDDLSTAEKKELSQLAETLVREAKQSMPRRFRRSR